MITSDFKGVTKDLMKNFPFHVLLGEMFPQVDPMCVEVGLEANVVQAGRSKASLGFV